MVSYGGGGFGTPGQVGGGLGPAGGDTGLRYTNPAIPQQDQLEQGYALQLQAARRDLAAYKASLDDQYQRAQQDLETMRNPNFNRGYVPPPAYTGAYARGGEVGVAGDGAGLPEVPAMAQGGTRPFGYWYTYGSPAAAPAGPPPGLHGGIRAAGGYGWGAGGAGGFGYRPPAPAQQQIHWSGPDTYWVQGPDGSWHNYTRFDPAGPAYSPNTPGPGALPPVPATTAAEQPAPAEAQTFTPPPGYTPSPGIAAAPKAPEMTPKEKRQRAAQDARGERGYGTPEGRASVRLMAAGGTSAGGLPPVPTGVNALVGDGQMGAGHRPEVLIDPEAIRLGLVHVATRPTAAALSPGTRVLPVNEGKTATATARGLPPVPGMAARKVGPRKYAVGGTAKGK